MEILKKLLRYDTVCIQCHDNPDADSVAAAFGLWSYLQANGKQAQIIYGGSQIIQKPAMKLLISQCEIPITHVKALPECDLLVMVDCQYGRGNVQQFAAPHLAVIDHHIPMLQQQGDTCICPEYQSCCTLVWTLLREAGYPVVAESSLGIALLYGLYTDTAAFVNLFKPADCAMRDALHRCQPLFERLTKSNLTVAELLIASDAMYNHWLDEKRHLAIVSALRCDQTILGVIGDFMIQVDAITLSFCYTEQEHGYQISVRSCSGQLPANEVAEFVCREIGHGGGHADKAGGMIIKEKLQKVYPGQAIFDVLKMRLCCCMDARRES